MAPFASRTTTRTITRFRSVCSLKVGSTSREEISCGLAVCPLSVQGAKAGIKVRKTTNHHEGNRALGRRTRVSEGNINPGPVGSNAGTLPFTTHQKPSNAGRCLPGYEHSFLRMVSNVKRNNGGCVCEALERQLAAAFLPASLPAGLRMRARFAASMLAGATLAAEKSFRAER